MNLLLGVGISFFSFECYQYRFEKRIWSREGCQRCFRMGWKISLWTPMYGLEKYRLMRRGRSLWNRALCYNAWERFSNLLGNGKKHDEEEVVYHIWHTVCLQRMDSFDTWHMVCLTSVKGVLSNCCMFVFRCGNVSLVIAYLDWHLFHPFWDDPYSLFERYCWHLS